jgi:hypothetical protein
VYVHSLDAGGGFLLSCRARMAFRLAILDAHDGFCIKLHEQHSALGGYSSFPRNRRAVGLMRVMHEDEQSRYLISMFYYVCDSLFDLFPILFS